MQKKALLVWFKRYDSILDGGGVANQRCLRMIQRVLGEENTESVYVHDERNRTGMLQKVRSAYYFLFDYHNGITPDFVASVVEKAKAYDYVFLSTSLFGIVAKRLKESGYKGRIIVHFHNVESIYYDATVPKWLPGRGIIVNCARNNDRYSCRYADKIITLNERDRALLNEMYGRKADVILPIAVQDRFVPVDETVLTSSRPLCLFIGSCFGPNNEGVLWFVRNVLPHVDIRFKIVGKNMASLKAANDCLKDIEVVSDAPDLRPYFEEADFMILPIFSGSGMKVKTCESLMYGKNILGSDETFEGYDVDAGKVGGRCNTSEEYITCLKNYVRHAVPRFNAYSRRLYLERYSEDASLNLFRELFQ